MLHCIRRRQRLLLWKGFWFQIWNKNRENYIDNDIVLVNNVRCSIVVTSSILWFAKKQIMVFQPGAKINYFTSNRQRHLPVQTVLRSIRDRILQVSRVIRKAIESQIQARFTSEKNQTEGRPEQMRLSWNFDDFANKLCFSDGEIFWNPAQGSLRRGKVPPYPYPPPEA